jgi:hypothetical protein
MHGIRSSITLMATLAIVMAVTGAGVQAQDENAGDHPILGAWIVDSTPGTGEDEPELITFHAEGSLRSVGPEGAAVGSWEPTGERSADVTAVSSVTDPTTGAFVGLLRFRGSVEVSEDGQSLTGTFTLEPPAAFAAAMGMPEGEFGPVEVTGERIVVEPMGEPIAPLPSFQPMTPEASPTA